MRVVSIIAMMSLATTAVAQQAQPSGIQGSTVSSAELVTKGLADGKRAADTTVSAPGWFVGGFVSGATLGLLGTLIVWGVASSSDVALPTSHRLLMAEQPTVYQQSFEAGYREKVKGVRKGVAVGGGLLGTAALVAVIVTQTR